MTVDPLEKLCALDAPVVLVPVRHHSPAAAQAVDELIRRLRPAAVLVEGPSDFNSRLDELHLPHQLPIAVYCHVRLEDGERRGAYYPFCAYSPEWAALGAARSIGAVARFIDVPFGAIAARDARANRYADAELRRSPYVDRLCRSLGVDDFDAAWDELFEIERLPVEAYLRRAHALCRALRELDPAVSAEDELREAFMAAQVEAAARELAGRVLVVTGGYHSLGILRALERGAAAPELAAPAESGLALTPYSYERLDRLTGYDAGMPGPGFYHRAWADRLAARPFRHQEVLRDVARALRRRGQTLSAADLIAAGTSAAALAALRGHEQVWRRDLVDGLTTAVLKDELARGGVHPLLDAVHEVLRGEDRGQLAEGTARPPLVLELHARLEALGLVPAGGPREVELALDEAEGRVRSACLHTLRVLGVAGFDRVDGTDFLARDDLSRLWERWRLRWAPELEATAVEASRLGATLPEAAASRLAERAATLERDAAAGAALLFDAAMADVRGQAATLQQRLLGLIDEDGDFGSVADALRHLLYLHRYDRILGALPGLEALVAAAWRRGLWLLERGGAGSSIERSLQGVALLVECLEACPEALSREDLIETLRRTALDGAQAPALRGAATGGLWTLGEVGDAVLREGVTAFVDPARLGDYLVGLFRLARETVQRQPELLAAIDGAILGYGEDEFLEALPALRLAFTWFTPREKHHLASTLLQGAGVARAPLAPLTVDPATAAEVAAFEARVLEVLRLHGLRGGEP